MEQTWIRGPVIGQGVTATVSLAFSVSDPNRIFAVKSSDISHSLSLQNEHTILSKIGPHPNLITVLGCDVSDGRCDLLTEFVPGGTLADQIKKQEKGRLDEQMVQFYTSKILMGLDFLHRNSVVHCDIKSENVLIGEDGIVKIADLGFSKTEGIPAAISGTPAFMAPEVARGELQGFASDIWALGCTIVEMATGKNPWPEETNPFSALYRIGILEDLPTIPSTLSDKGRDFVGKCFVKEARERWTARELLKHPFVSEVNVVDNSMLKKNRSSPTCVLDLAFWDQLDAPADDEHEDCYDNDDDGDDSVRVCSYSAFERIERLHSNPPTSSWTFDENWITVRTNSVHQQCQEVQGSGISLSKTAEVGSSSTLLRTAEDDCVLLLNPICNNQPL